MPGRAAGLRARLSAAAAVALPCARAQMPEANAMENPAAIATQLTALAGSPCAKAGTANESTESTMNNLLSLLICVAPRMKYRQWVVDAIPCRRPHAERPYRTVKNLNSVLVGQRALQIDGGQQNENVGLQ